MFHEFKNRLCAVITIKPPYAHVIGPFRIVNYNRTTVQFMMVSQSLRQVAGDDHGLHASLFGELHLLHGLRQGMSWNKRAYFQPKVKHDQHGVPFTRKGMLPRPVFLRIVRLTSVPPLEMLWRKKQSHYDLTHQRALMIGSSVRDHWHKLDKERAHGYRDKGENH